MLRKIWTEFLTLILFNTFKYTFLTLKILTRKNPKKSNFPKKNALKILVLKNTKNMVLTKFSVKNTKNKCNKCIKLV